MTQTAVGAAFGAVIAVLLGQLVGPLVGHVERRVASPLRIENGREVWADGPNREVWEFIMARASSGPYLGAVEVLVFFIGFWTSSPIIVGAWLAFKVASKWQSWPQVANLPSPPPPDNADEMAAYALLRHKWVARRGVTFLFGTGANMVIAAFSAAMGELVVRYG